MKPTFDLIIVIPVGPGTQLSFLRDTIDSCIHYTRASYKIVIADNSQEGVGETLMPEYSKMDVVVTDKATDAMGGLYITLSHIYAYVLGSYNFRLLMKLDTDALITGPGPELDALELFEADPLMAMAGQYPLDYYGQPWDSAWPRARIINGTSTWKFIARPAANLALRKIYLKALNNGYKAGESVFGGSYYISRDFVEEMHHQRLLPKTILSTVRLGEDHIFSLLAKSFGMNLGDLSGKIPVFACAWKGLPASPEQLYQGGRKVIHSTRGWNEMKEKEVREYFSDKRQEELIESDRMLATS